MKLPRAEPGSIARRLALIVAAVTVLVTVLSLSALLAWSQRRYDESLHRRAQALLSYLEGSLQLPLWSLDAETAATIGAAVAHDEIVSALEIVDHRGGVYFREDKGERVAFDETGKLFHEDRPIGEVRLRISARPGQRFLGRVAAVAGISGVLVIALQLLLIGPLLRRQLRAPFSTLNATIQSYQAGTLRRAAARDPLLRVRPDHRRAREHGPHAGAADRRAAGGRGEVPADLRDGAGGHLPDDPEGAWVDVNPAWLEFMGFESLEDLQTHVENVRQLYADPADRDALLAQLGPPATSRAWRCACAASRATLWGSITADAVLDAQGRVSLIEGIVDDVTEAKRIQELLIQTEKMTSVGGLAAGMAHELNNPLGIVLQSLENLERRLSPASPPTSPRRGSPASTGRGRPVHGSPRDSRVPGGDAAGRRARGRDHPDDARLQPHRGRGCRAVPAPGHRRHRARARGEGLRPAPQVRLPHGPHRPRARSADAAGRVHRARDGEVVLNVVKNAAEALAEARAGEPTIHVRMRSDGGFARLEIQDNGPGMDEPTRRRVFEPYFSTKAPGEGTGLGLSVAYFIVTQRNGGTITVASTPGQGSEFVIRLPLPPRTPRRHDGRRR